MINKKTWNRCRPTVLTNKIPQKSDLEVLARYARTMIAVLPVDDIKIRKCGITQWEI